MFKYFDLNRRPFSEAPPAPSESEEIPLEDAFARRDATREESKDKTKAPDPQGTAPVIPPPRKELSVLQQFVIYVGIVIGVAFSSVILQFHAGKIPQSGITWGMLGIACLVGLVILPQLYEKLQLTSDKPIVVQLGLAVQNGVFWQVLFAGIGKALTPG